MSELENVNGGVGCKKKKFLFQSLGQVLGYDDCYDSGTCPHGYTFSGVKQFWQLNIYKRHFLSQQSYHLNILTY